MADNSLELEEFLKSALPLAHCLHPMCPPAQSSPGEPHPLPPGRSLMEALSSCARALQRQTASYPPLVQQQLLILVLSAALGLARRWYSDLASAGFVEYLRQRCQARTVAGTQPSATQPMLRKKWRAEEV
jgi:hypothetical protein